jgi:hypothetical protein
MQDIGREGKGSVTEKIFMRSGRTMILIIKQVFVLLGFSLTESADFLAPA